MYYTMDAPFIESMWWSLKELYNKGLLYEGHKVVAYSTRAGTPLSTHEVNEGGYKEVEDPSVTLKFELNDKPGTFVLAWTTTPWTLPANLLLAVNTKLEYVEVSHEGDNYIVAKERVEDVFEGLEHKVTGSVNAEDLIDQTYKPLFPHFKEKADEGLFKIIHSRHTSDEDGTGIVHLAPYGAEDFEILMGMGATLFDYLDDTAHFTDLVPEYEGLFYKAANKKIIADLQANGTMFKSERAMHRVGLCWRTGTPLIYKPLKSWYVAVTKIKDRMLEENQGVNWLPEHLKDGMSAQWLGGARDWALSRKRYWGTPLPIWINDKTGEKVIIGSFEELEKLSGVQIEDPHRPFVDEITWEADGGTFKRIEDVIDVWYDSGAVPFAKLHYPFENKDKFEEMVPAEYISEGLDQVRLWFYTMHVLGVALFDKVPYKNVVTTGMLLAKNGDKLSKSKRNFPPMDEVLDNFGGDILRMFLLTSPIVQAQPTRFSEEALLDTKKELFLPLWNSAKYFITYAELNDFEATFDKPSGENDLDKWILVRLKEVINSVTEEMESYKFMEASRELAPFVSDLSTWYIRRSRDRLRTGDKEALQTLYYVLTNFTKLIAPMTPFISEHLYEALGMRELSKIASVHLDFYPEAEMLTEEEVKLLTDMKNDRTVVSKILSLRAENKISVRQPLSSFETIIPVTFEDVVKDEVNVKEVVNVKLLPDELEVKLNTEITEELEIEGLARDMTRKIQSLRKQAGLQVSDRVSVIYEENEKTVAAVSKFGDEMKKTVGATELTPGSEYAVSKTN